MDKITISSIESGDLVNVYISHGRQLLNAIVLGLPCATGDCWRIATNDGGLFYVQQFECIELIRKDAFGMMR